MNSGKLDEEHLTRIENALQKVPFAKLIGIELEEVDAGVATLALDIREELKQNHGVVHGGAVASLIDSATAFAIISILPPDERATTVDLTISYLRPLTTGRIRAKARVVRAGRRLIVVSAEVFDDSGTLTATALSTYLKI
ncbi:MAG: PaaI family thioesterase [Pyrinomonadaceae bacterium]